MSWLKKNLLRYINIVWLKAVRFSILNNWIIAESLRQQKGGKFGHFYGQKRYVSQEKYFAIWGCES